MKVYFPKFPKSFIMYILIFFNIIYLGVYRALQFGQVLACISMTLIVMYSFVSLLLRQYLRNKVYVMAIFYAVAGTETVQYFKGRYFGGF